MILRTILYIQALVCGIQPLLAQSDTASKVEKSPSQKILIQDSTGITSPMPNSPLRNIPTEPMPVAPRQPSDSPIQNQSKKKNKK